jgi:hypothetical protein
VRFSQRVPIGPLADSNLYRTSLPVVKGCSVAFTSGTYLQYLRLHPNDESKLGCKKHLFYNASKRKQS